MVGFQASVHNLEVSDTVECGLWRHKCARYTSLVFSSCCSNHNYLHELYVVP